MTPRCRSCGRVLRTEQSKARGIGPVCGKASQPRTAPRIPTPHPDHHIDGQTELPLTHLQPTLWSA